MKVDRHVQVSGLSPLEGRANYMIGKDPATWVRGVPTFGQVEYTRIYPGVNVVFYGNGGELEHDFRVAAGADPNRIVFRVRSGDGLRINDAGDLEFATSGGKLILRRPVAYQTIGGRRQEIEAGFKLTADGTVGFSLGKYDRGRELVIDPVLSFATYLDTLADTVFGVAADAAGNTYITGITDWPTFPTTAGVFERTCCSAGGYYVFVTKLNPTGTAEVYSTLLGGSNDGGQNTPAGLAVDSKGNAIVTGMTMAHDFPIKNPVIAPDNSAGPIFAAFVTSLSADGSELNFSDAMGNYASASAVAVDAQDNVYITGNGGLFELPFTAGALYDSNAQAAGTGTFVSKFTPTGSLAYSALVGDAAPQGPGAGAGGTTAIVVDAQGSAYITGAAGTLYPTTAGSYAPQLPNSPYRGVFVSKLHPDGSKLDYSTFVGLGDAYAIGLDQDNDVWFAGDADSNIYPVTSNAYSNKFSSEFLSELSPDGSQLLYSTYFPATIRAVQVDAKNNLWISGGAGNLGIPLVDAVFSTIAQVAGTTFGGGVGEAS